MHNLFNSLTVAPPPALFYPFGSGVGDTLNPRSDDGSSPAINLQSPFTFFRRTYTKLYVNNNGHLTFDQPWDSYTPTQFNAYSGRDIIAPLWTDIDNRGAGTISYNQYSNGNVLSQATRDINQHFPQFIFTASWVFVATWDKVAYYSYSGTVTFQVVLVSDSENRSYVLMNYGSIPPSPQVWMAGYKTENNTYNFTIQASNTSSLSSTTNVGIPGRWVFRVDGTASAPSTFFFPMLPGAIQHAVTVDGGSRLIQLDYPFFYFGKPHSQLYLSMDGFLAFEPLYTDAYNPTLNKDIIAPLWTDIDSYTRGNISYEQATNGSLIELATNEMNSMFSGLNFSASWVFVGTWEKMEFEPDTGVRVTFQVVLVSDSKNRSYVLMNYGSIPPDPLPWMVRGACSSLFLLISQCFMILK
uniref:NIDO domain-containing protein n=1 Tax=Pygocentrus nattereri TaxID=42514 RepID=A0A3B4D523_PYGNA